MSNDEAKREQFFAEIDRALREDRFVPAYQPIFCLRSGRLVSVEALARLVEKNGEIKTPASFYPALQNPVLGTKISERILARAIVDFAALCDAGFIADQVSVNITELQVLDETFLPRVLESLATSGVAPQSLVFEFTEDVMFSRHPDQIKRQAERFATAGIKLSLDDFGTGFASLKQLLEFPVDQIKIDRSFVSPMKANPRAYAIAAAVAQMGRQLGLEVVGEGIEDDDAEALALKIGCDLGQGFLYAKPLLLPELLPYLAARMGPDGRSDSLQSQPLRQD